MFAKIRSSNFIDTLQLELHVPKGNQLRAVLKDDTGFVCSILEKNIATEDERFTWSGLNHLPYGRYTLELTQGNDEQQLQLVKRV